MLLTKTIPVLIVSGTVNYYRSKEIICKLVKLEDVTKENFNTYLNNIKEQNATI